VTSPLLELFFSQLVSPPRRPGDHSRNTTSDRPVLHPDGNRILTPTGPSPFFSGFPTVSRSSGFVSPELPGFLSDPCPFFPRCAGGSFSGWGVPSMRLFFSPPAFAHQVLPAFGMPRDELRLNTLPVKTWLF